jgi:F-type H+-transporting ATPase subunit delta
MNNSPTTSLSGSKGLRLADDARVERYADALFALAEATGRLAEIEARLPPVVDLLTDHGPLREFLADPAVSVRGKTAALDEVLAGQAPDLLLRFLAVLQDEGALTRLPEIQAAFHARVSGRHAARSGEVVSACPLSEDRVEAIAREASRILGAPVRLRPRVAPGIVGGVCVQVGDWVLDGTVEYQLTEARRQLIR